MKVGNISIVEKQEGENNIALKAPKKWKLMLLVWVTIYPLLNIFFPLLMPYIVQLPQPIRLLIMTIIIVPIMSFILGQLHKRLHLWLRE
ncbi:hypothetical protein [Oceanospirillum linum]|uniref:hypothetical protein n=1 Tax=Oceanospirillum linum TaxID=966 RepID=UPI00089EBAF0|nr:hypothetical protein [Oceanospirillum linum]SEG44058.1 hypothetical protein SAMN04489856_11118 [Oleiphilus messinensis]SMP34265.1 hypothetical protein SAMN06264348_11117 [Oceanospirillum linum]